MDNSQVGSPARGGPQGSVITLFCWLVYINDICLQPSCILDANDDCLPGIVFPDQAISTSLFIDYVELRTSSYRYSCSRVKLIHLFSNN